MAAKLTVEQRGEIVAARRAGTTDAELAAKYGVSKGYVRQLDNEGYARVKSKFRFNGPYNGWQNRTSKLRSGNVAD
jgi:hypothetical protein